MTVCRGIYLRTTYFMARWLTWDRIAPVIKAALETAANEDGLRIFKYKAKVKTTSPYRIFSTDGLMDADFMLTGTDVPFGSQHSGLQLYEYRNHHLFDELPRTYRDKNGMQFEVVPPKGWNE